MENLETTNVPIIATDLYGLALAIQDGFEKMIQEEEWVCVREIRFYIAGSSINQDGTQPNIDYYVAELRKMILPNTTMHLLKYDWHADRSWQGGITDFDVFELHNPCDYEEILSVVKKYFEERCADRLLDLENIHIDASSIDDYWQRATVTQDDPQELELVPCKDCKYGHTQCKNQSGLFYQMSCKAVKWCEQGEAC